MKKSNLRATSALQALALLGAGLPAAFVVSAPAYAQDITSAEISGIVQDQNGNPVAGATVTLTSIDRAFTRTTTTGAAGTYNFDSLPFGTYDIAATSATGSGQVTGAEARLGGSAYTIVVGAADGEAIVVTAQRAQALDFSQAATGTVIDVQEVAKRLPIPRDINNLQLLAPQSVAGDPDPALGNQSVALAGSSIAENIYYVNGMNITNFRTFVGGTTVPFEFYDQVQVKTGGYQAEFGRSTGGAVIAVTRSGSNEFRAGANVFYQPNALRSTQPDTYTADNDRDVVRSLEGNVYVSGPILKDHLYAFAFVNPRNEYAFGATRADVASSYSEARFSQEEPFYGGRLDFDLFGGHRAELTYFRDLTKGVTDLSTFNSATGAFTGNSISTDTQGGTNLIGRYSASVADWLTLSALYGKSTYERTVAGTADDLVYTADYRSGTGVFVQGSPNAIVENGDDEREQYRFDADLNFDFMGSHRMRMGWDREHLRATATTQYSGGAARLFWISEGSEAELELGLTEGTPYYDEYIYISGGSFKNRNTAWYIQDNWDVTDRLQLSLGLRNDRFENFTANGDHFFDSKNNWGPRIGATYDLSGDRRTKLSGFFGRYYLPIAANTNIRYAGNEFYTYEVNRLLNDDILNPQGQQVYFEVYSDTAASPQPADALRSEGIKPQYMDEFIIGAEHRFGGGWRAAVNLVHRDLKSVIEDTDIALYAMRAYCAEQDTPVCNPGGYQPGDENYDEVVIPDTIGGGGYILLNPGDDATFQVDIDGDGDLDRVTLTAEQIGIPRAKRKYWGAEFSFERAFDGVWTLMGSYTWSKTRGNYEGGVNSDYDQDDVGLTQDFDEPGWTDGAYGYLANDRRHVLKLAGAYQLFGGLMVSGSARLGSPKRYSCFGNYPFDDGRAITNSNNSYYCNLNGTPGQLTPRGTAFKGPWDKRVDLGVAYNLPLRGLRQVQARVDVFNVFNWTPATEYVVDSESNSGQPGVNYGKPQYYAAPRYVRLGLSFDF